MHLILTQFSASFLLLFYMCHLITGAITHLFSTMVMLELQMTRQSWMVTCGEKLLEVFFFLGKEINRDNNYS